MIEIRLREAMDAYEAKTGERLTYSDLADRTGLARATIESIAARTGYNASLKAIDALCEALRCPLSTLVHRREDQ